MSQEEIIELLKKEGEMPTKDIAIRLEINTRAVWKACKALLGRNELICEIKQKEGDSRKATRKIYWRVND